MVSRAAALECRDAVVVRGGRRILDTVSLTIHPGELVAVLGPNGAGKSTLLRALAGDFVPNSGEVHLCGRPLASWNLAERARVRAVLLQDLQVGFAPRVRDVVALGHAPHGATHGDELARRMAVDEALARVEMSSFADRSMPTLSGGERQLVHLARTLVQIGPLPASSPRFLLLDEPTASLDLAHRHRVLAIAREVARQGVGVLAILHDLDLALAHADRALLLANGCVHATGDPVDVITPATVRTVYGIECERVVTRVGARPHLVVVPPGSASRPEGDPAVPPASVPSSFREGIRP